MVPADDQAIVLPCASVMVIIVLLNVAFTCATPEAMFLRSRLRTRVASLPIGSIPFAACRPTGGALASPGKPEIEILLRFAGPRGTASPQHSYFFLPAIAFAGPLRVRALVCVRWPRTGRPRRCRNPR